MTLLDNVLTMVMMLDDCLHVLAGRQCGGLFFEHFFEKSLNGSVQAARSLIVVFSVSFYPRKVDYFHLSCRVSNQRFLSDSAIQ